MSVVSHLLRGFELATAEQREQVLSGLVDLLTEDELANLDKFRARKTARFDIFGSLPMELRIFVLRYLDVPDIHASTLVCRRWQHLLLGCNDIVDHLLQDRFPLFKHVAAEERPQVLSRALRTWFFRATGRFRSRFTSTFGLHSDGSPAPGRLERLQLDRTYTDVSCFAATRHHYTEPETCMSPRTCYAEGWFAWQQSSVVSSMQPIILHNLRTNVQKVFKHPRQSIVSGLMVQLLALGNDLLIGSYHRKM